MSNLFNDQLFNENRFNGDAQIGVSADDDIVFNNYGLQNSNIVISYMRHKSGHETEYVMSNIARSHGVRMQDLYRRGKIITARGYVKATTAEGMIDRVDEMKKYLRQLNGVLKITRGSRVRQYYATLNNPNGMFEEEEAFHNTIIPFNLEFFASYFGFSESRKTYTHTITAASTTRELVHEGNADEGRIITYIIVNSETDMTKITWTNAQTGESISVEPSAEFTAGDVLVIDGENQTVKLNGTIIEYTGLIPSIVPDSNDFTLDVVSTSHNLTMTNKFYHYYS